MRGTDAGTLSPHVPANLWRGSRSLRIITRPQAACFGVGKIERARVEDYAKRKGWSLAMAERSLAPILNCDPRHAPSIAAA
jgi:5-methyltetrahydrofolate--homocysteine methyltransferase